MKFDQFDIRQQHSVVEKQNCYWLYDNNIWQFSCILFIHIWSQSISTLYFKWFPPMVCGDNIAPISNQVTCNHHVNQRRSLVNMP